MKSFLLLATTLVAPPCVRYILHHAVCSTRCPAAPRGDTEALLGLKKEAKGEITFIAGEKGLTFDGQALDAIAKEHGCLDPPLLENQRPLGVDRLEQIFRASAESRLMELFQFHFRQTGYTLKQVFLLTPAYGTVDPANLEAILSTKFEGEGPGACCE